MEYNFTEQELINIQNKYSLDVVWLLAEDCLKLREELALYKTQLAPRADASPSLQLQQDNMMRGGHVRE